MIDAAGKPVSGFSLEDCPWIYGDSLTRPVECLQKGKITLMYLASPNSRFDWSSN